MSFIKDLQTYNHTLARRRTARSARASEIVFKLLVRENGRNIGTLLIAAGIMAATMLSACTQKT